MTSGVQMGTGVNFSAVTPAVAATVTITTTTTVTVLVTIAPAPAPAPEMLATSSKSKCNRKIASLCIIASGRSPVPAIVAHL